MIDQAEAVVGQRLLDHREPVAVEGAEHRGVGRRVGGVAVDVEREVGERGAHGGDHVGVPAGPELQLDAREAGIDRRLDLPHQDVERVLDAEVGADRHGLTLAAERDVQRYPPAGGVQHPPGELQGRPRELIALHEIETAQQVVGRADVLPDDPRRQMLAHGVERGQGVLGGVVGDVRRTALAPGVMPLALHPDQDRVGEALVAVRRLPHEGQRHPRPVDVDPLDQHRAGSVTAPGR